MHKAAKLAAVPVKGDTRLDLADSDHTGAEPPGSKRRWIGALVVENYD